MNTDTRSDSIHILDISISANLADFSYRILFAKTNVTFQAKVNGINAIKLDLLGLTIDSVYSGNTVLKFSYDDSVISINLPSAMEAGQQKIVTIVYHGKPLQVAGDFGGFYWDDTYAFNIGVSFLSTPHNYGKVWFPCFDNFVERSTYHFAITTDNKHRAVCNGQEDSIVQNSNSTVTWYWTMPDPIPPYLASVAVSNYVILQDSCKGINRTISIWLAARPADTANLRKSFIHLKNAISIFEKRFGPYAFNKIGYCLVPFTAGAMEHATNIAYMQSLVNGNTAYENVMAHELSHHWFGNLVTCDNESEMWLNEGWAKYCEEIFFGDMYGQENYKTNIRDNHEDVIRMAHIADSAYLPLSPIPHQYTYSNYSIYEKGADRIHTLRGYMGDSLFFGCIKSYLQQYKFKWVNSYTLRDYLVSSSGMAQIKDFFTDWVFDGGFPDFYIAHKAITRNGDNYNAALIIRQCRDHTSHYFSNVPLPIAFFDAAGNKTVTTANVSDICTQYSTVLPFYPVYIALDFDEKIGDAVTDQWFKMAGKDQRYEFGNAKMSVNLIQSSDTTLLRIEHHWVAPDASKNNIPGLHLSDYRYWNVDGILSADFQASATVYYNGPNSAQGLLDETFITNREDSLVLMYRPDAENYWQIDTDIVLKTGNDLNDKIGVIKIKNLRRGQYALAIYDASRANAPDEPHACDAVGTPVSIDSVEGVDVYPNLLHTDEINIELHGSKEFARCVMINMIGEKVMDRPLQAGQKKVMIYMNGLPRGTYMLRLIDKDNKQFSKKIQKVN